VKRSVRAPGVPSGLTHRTVRVLKPVDAADVYAHPRAELRRLAGHGLVRRIAHGYYAVVPQDRVDDPGWHPSSEAAGWGVAAADYGPDAVCLMGLSAARIHAAIPRALAVAVIAVPKQRPSLRLMEPAADVQFVRRDVSRLDVERTTTSLGDGWVTTVEQTVLDLAARPQLGGVPKEAQAAVTMLLQRADEALLAELATSQRRRATLRRLLENAA
jgi:predicted transcriptional regulator of viral defense system